MGVNYDLSLPVPCNASMAALVDQAFQHNTRHEQPNDDITFAAGYCQFSSNSTLADEAKTVWLKASAYGYQPSRGFAAFALAAFSLAALFHLYQLVRSRRWSYITILVGLALQLYGWWARYVAGGDLQREYTAQLASLTIAPTFFSAALYSLFSIYTASDDPTLLPGLKPRTVMWWFIVIDFVTLVVQAAGGAIAAGDVSLSVFNVGCHIMLAGIVLQLITTFVFLAVLGIYFRRLRPERTDALSIRRGSGVVLYGVCGIAAMIIIRGLYRSAELGEGLFGPIATTQAALICADAIPMIIAVFLLAATHPLYTVKPPTSSSTGDSSTALNLSRRRRQSTAGGRGAARRLRWSRFEDRGRVALRSGRGGRGTSSTVRGVYSGR